MSKTRKRQPPEIETKRNRSQRREQRELMERYNKRRQEYPDPEPKGRYAP